MLSKGENIAMPAGIVRLDVDIAAGDADVSAYLLDASGRVRGDDDMIFYNQPRSPDGAVVLDGRGFAVDLAEVEADVQRIAVCTVPEAGTVARLARVSIGTPDAFSYAQDTGAMSEAALILGELYRRDGAWKFRAVGQGFDGGLASLSRHFGIDVEDETTAMPSAAPPAPSASPPPPPSPPPVSLTKVTLEKAGRVKLRKGGGAIRARLVWEGRGGGQGDLDLYCFYVTKDGTRGKVYWKDLGRDQGAPWITLSGDSRRAGEEEIVLHRPDELRFALFAAYSALSNGSGSFQSYRPRMILTDQDGSEVVIPLLNPNSTSYWVAISHVAIDDGVAIEHIETYGKSGVRAWIAAERSPRLHADGTWDVSKGPVEFKRT
jgi:stress response protein SCP2